MTDELNERRRAGDETSFPVPTSINAQVVLPATADDRKGQRRINLIWESTQACIAVGVSGATVYAALRGISSEILGNAFVLIIAIYFVRMNHTKVGGPGGTDHR